MATADSMADGLADKPAGKGGRRKLLLAALPILLAGGGAGAWCSMIVDEGSLPSREGS